MRSGEEGKCIRQKEMVKEKKEEVRCFRC